MMNPLSTQSYLKKYVARNPIKIVVICTITTKKYLLVHYLIVSKKLIVILKILAKKQTF